MKLVSMKMDAEAVKDRTSPAVAPSDDRPLYPWGLTLRLDEDTLAKLGIELPTAGASMRLEAQVDVTEVSVREEVEDGEPKQCRNLSLQITDLGLSPAATKDASAALYDKA